MWLTNNGIKMQTLESVYVQYHQQKRSLEFSKKTYKKKTNNKNSSFLKGKLVTCFV